LIKCHCQKNEITNTETIKESCNVVSNKITQVIYTFKITETCSNTITFKIRPVKIACNYSISSSDVRPPIDEWISNM
jgi:hypothetical protein